jgi:hypothetical protein
MSDTQGNIPPLSSIASMDRPVSTANEGPTFSNATQEPEVEIVDSEPQTSWSQVHTSQTTHRPSLADNLGATTFPFISLTPALSQSEVIAEINRLARVINSRATLAPIEPPPRTLQNSQACFTGVPFDIRAAIYEYTLYNSLLAQSRSVSRYNGYGATMQYDLCPQLLMLSRDINKETLKYLYERNTFYMACLPSRDQSPFFARIHISAVTRYMNESSPGYPSLVAIPAIERVRKWNAVLSARDAGEDIPNSPPWSFLDFCRAICGKPPKSLDIAIIRKSVENGLGDSDYQRIELILEPIRLLRSIERFQLRDTTPFEIPDDIDEDEDALEYPSHLDDLSAEIEVELTLLAQGHEPLECAFKMYPRILKYAQAFELNINFREEMSLTQDQSLSQEWLGDNYDFYNSNALRNPFKGYLAHPVEAGLMRAKLASDRENLVQFKNERANILEYLENQYQRISAASTRVIDFVKTEKKVGELLDAESHGDPVRICYDSELALEKIGEAMTLVEEYAETFKRDMPMQMKKDIRRHQRIFDSFYAGSTCETLMGQLREAFDIGDWRRFVNLFRSTTSNLDTKYLSILRARKNLFEEDDLSLNSVGCNINFELSLTDEEINWSLNEPEFAVLERNDHGSVLFDGSSDEDQEIERINNWGGSEGESEGSVAGSAEQDDVNEEGERSSQDGLDDEDGLDNEDISGSEDGSDSEDISDNGQDLEQF